MYIEAQSKNPIFSDDRINHMKLIIGLGNPGKEYAKTRHNAGFRVVDVLAGEATWKKEKKFNALIAETEIAKKKVLLAKPLTFMNDSGKTARQIIDYYKISLKDALIIYDDIDLLVGQIRLRPFGSAGGHNGMESVLEHLGTQDVARLRIGIAEKQAGKQDVPSEEYVLKNFSKSGEKKIKDALQKIPNYIESWVKNEVKNISYS